MFSSIVLVLLVITVLAKLGSETAGVVLSLLKLVLLEVLISCLQVLRFGLELASLVHPNWAVLYWGWC